MPAPKEIATIAVIAIVAVGLFNRLAPMQVKSAING